MTELTIAQAAAETGLTAHTLRYYERDGLMLGSVDRSTAGHRRYTRRDLSWIEMITRLRATGMPIRDVRRYAELVRTGAGNEAQLSEVTSHLRAIDHKIGLYEGQVERAS